MSAALNDPLLVAAVVGLAAMLFWPQIGPLLAKLQKPKPAPDDLVPVVIPDDPVDGERLEVSTDDESRAVAWLLAERGRWHAAGREDVCKALTSAARTIVGGAR